MAKQFCQRLSEAGYVTVALSPQNTSTLVSLYSYLHTHLLAPPLPTPPHTWSPSSLSPHLPQLPTSPTTQRTYPPYADEFESGYALDSTLAKEFIAVRLVNNKEVFKVSQTNKASEPSLPADFEQNALTAFLLLQEVEQKLIIHTLQQQQQPQLLKHQLLLQYPHQQQHQHSHTHPRSCICSGTFRQTSVTRRVPRIPIAGLSL
eukprot:TRINITY_DN10639_c0_g2_i1.p1 TRINITY_DN10639_c0_g2~~TRINITY_DN10639_c0_g2_i1.p1  ORF type:complete len:204 (-),score=42.83 TRINITY_DN10639_c0_g2_i1:225-836(-)